MNFRHWMRPPMLLFAVCLASLGALFYFAAAHRTLIGAPTADTANTPDDFIVEAPHGTGEPIQEGPGESARTRLQVDGENSPRGLSSRSQCRSVKPAEQPPSPEGAESSALIDTKQPCG